MATTDPQADTARLLGEAEIAAEKLVSLLRMVVAGGLLAFFAVTVGPWAPAGGDTLDRQWAFALATMAGYFLVGFVAWRLGCRGRLKRWMIWVTVTTDSVLLLINVWLSLENFGLAGQYVFVLPAAWLALIALAFGMLRVDPAVQIYTAVWMVAGLGAMALVDPAPDGRGPATGGWISFFLGDRPNLMRLAMIALAGGILVTAARRTRDLLLRSITETRARANLVRYLPAQLAGELAEGELDRLRRGKREEMAILFVDIRGFTQMSEAMTPEEVSAFISEFRARLTGVVKRCGGMIDKFVGDAAMILFPAGDDPRAAAGNALRCAEAIQTDIAEWSAEREAAGLSPVRVGTGGHWGEVFSGVVGDDARLEYSVFGDAVNVAARLEDMTKTLGAPIVLSRDLLDRAGGDGPGKWTYHGRTGLRGRDQEVEVLACSP
ncbi:MAG: adenylate/guanylate cyclase domain-containing protein [Marinibacterium sp.]